MNIQTTKIELVKAILDSESNTFLQKIADFVKNEKQSSSSIFTPSDTELKERAEASLKSIEEGSTRDISEFITEVENWKNQHAI